MELREARYDDVVVLAVSGRLDHETSMDFQMELLAAVAPQNGRGAKVVLDFSGVHYISSVGLRALVIGAKECKGADGALSVADPSPLVHEVLEISRFHHVIAIHETVGAAIAAVSEGALAAYDAARA